MGKLYILYCDKIGSSSKPLWSPWSFIYRSSWKHGHRWDQFKGNKVSLKLYIILVLLILPYFLSSPLPCCPEAPLTYADPLFISEAIKALKASKNPLVIIGKGMYICSLYIHSSSRIFTYWYFSVVGAYLVNYTLTSLYYLIHEE